MDTPPALDVSTLRIGVVVNTSSGGCDATAQADLERELGAAGCRSWRTWRVAGDGVDEALRQAHALPLDLLVVLGGDGTIRAAAESCQPGHPLLLPLPGGTMNRLARELYGRRPWRETLRETLANPGLRSVPGGQVGRLRFYVSAIVGNAALLGEAREALRSGHLGSAIRHAVVAMKKAMETPLQFHFGQQGGTADAVYVRCPVALNGADRFEVAVFSPQGAWDALKLTLKRPHGRGRPHGSVFTAGVDRVAVESSEPIPAVLDGELVELGRAASFEFVPAAFTAVVPEARSR